MFLGNTVKRIKLKNITMVFVIIASAIYIGRNSSSVFKYIGETYNDLMSMWLVNMYVEGKIDTLIITDEREIEAREDSFKRHLEYIADKQKLAHLKVILKNTSSKTLPVNFGINFYDKNDKLFLEKYPLPFTWLNGGVVDTLNAQYFSLPRSQINKIKRYELKVFYNKPMKKNKGFQ